MSEKKKILITVKTYPLPSESYMELVCTGGVLEDGSFIRLYPIDYRYRAYWEWYKKSQWIEVEIEKNKKDIRPESYRPVPGKKIKILGEPLPTRNNWALRKQFVLAKEIHTMCWLDKQKQNQCSIGIVHIREVSDLIIEPDERDWKPKWKAHFKQISLFGPKRKPLEKIPYKFSYVFKCDEPSCKGHTKMIEDWEIGQLYRSMRDKYKSEEIAVQKVKHKLLNVMCAPDVNTHFFVGTIRKYGTWIILGVFWPKKTKN